VMRKVYSISILRSLLNGYTLIGTRGAVFNCDVTPANTTITEQITYRNNQSAENEVFQCI
jgi:hypothetical protein